MMCGRRFPVFGPGEVEQYLADALVMRGRASLFDPRATPAPHSWPPAWVYDQHVERPYEDPHLSSVDRVRRHLSLSALHRHGHGEL